MNNDENIFFMRISFLPENSNMEKKFSKKILDNFIMMLINRARQIIAKIMAPAGRGTGSSSGRPWRGISSSSLQSHHSTFGARQNLL
ncbi:MAG TPA: hypothetical protein VLX68_11565 [Chitinivibrionales bacterium]|nr:hypothetical protein [Chitinivibrionales bacterium]